MKVPKYRDYYKLEKTLLPQGKIRKPIEKILLSPLELEIEDLKQKGNLQVIAKFINTNTKYFQDKDAILERAKIIEKNN